METLIEQFRKDLEIRKCSKDTIEQYPQILRRFGEFVGGDLLAVDKKKLIAYADHLKNLSIDSRRRYFSAIGSFYEFAIEAELIQTSPITPGFKKRYLHAYKDNRQSRKSLTTDEARKLIDAIFTTRERAPIVLLLKTGIRLGELISLDLDDLDLPNLRIRLKPTAKRSNLTVFIDDETARLLRKWLAKRETMAKSTALFLNAHGDRYSRDSFELMFTKYSTVAGLHDASSKRLEDRCTPHTCRHFFTTEMRDRGMQREYVKKLRGDAVTEAIDIYNHISAEKLKKAYLDCVPQFGL